ncbi:TetR/AcrR family transcriptional regulator [Mycobacterium montefiorense]|uniref:TetR family transcriptional regulator n=1 Tax=Mycobacterium montefiorense TaxID=154654 RepID=A0AA37PK98_9MYCO|nr:TetR/AcrR family transcriptional regulator [Mycobacterium montefiorense]GBG40082.1 TetR family transcriptional regulator [Mycobacterium montefiorense]GKU33557.1 TetR family transcriptional regulator [Mycobacterium montefiorense]GKU39495.1 TetR family transcriptional regulator [Mycobacterium montefiorense]GKU43772.1 TetR family transcriptional regulator [Mycobacterium montefiorense]GKU52736.1 TetR family transcriptional regulator [Mycobacterium montefiorense]
MARQVRSEVTRRKILNAAIDVFGDVGYSAAGWGTIIERTGMTKGALYHHFDSKESLASAIIEEGAETLLNGFRNVCGAASPGLENLLHGTFTIVGMLSSDDTARAAEQLTCTLRGFNEAAGRFCKDMVELLATEARRAIAEGDLQPGLDPEAVSESIVGAMFGTRALSDAMSALGEASGSATGDLERLTRVWELLLPGIVSEASLPYFRQFLAREVMRYARPAVTRGEPAAVSEIG